MSGNAGSGRAGNASPLSPYAKQGRSPDIVSVHDGREKGGGSGYNPFAVAEAITPLQEAEVRVTPS